MSLELVAEIVAFVVFLALVVERLVELFLGPSTHILVFVLEEINNGKVILPTHKELVGWFLSVAVLIFGLTLSVAFNIDIFTPLAESVGLEPISNQAGLIMTGLVLGGGSSFLHDLWPQKK